MFSSERQPKKGSRKKKGWTYKKKGKTVDWKREAAYKEKAAAKTKQQPVAKKKEHVETVEEKRASKRRRRVICGGSSSRCRGVELALTRSGCAPSSSSSGSARTSRACTVAGPRTRRTRA